MNTLEKLILYPVKGLGGTPKQYWRATRTGLLFDRQWMLLDEEGRFITQRKIPELCLFQADIEDDFVRVTYKGQEITWWLDELKYPTFETKVWDDIAFVHSVNEKVDQFFSDNLKEKVKLVRQSDTFSRLHFVKSWEKEIPVSLADAYPYLLLGSKSVDYLNQQLESPVSFQRFRPNLFISTTSPHEEDEYPHVHIGEVHFKNVKPCIRCQVINIDPQNGVPGKEPTRKLSEYRKFNHGIQFGTNMICIQEGILQTGIPAVCY